MTAPPSLPQISGIVILGIGIWIQISLDKYVEVSPEFSDSVPYVFIASGGLIILLGTFACCCTVKTQPVLLYIVSDAGRVWAVSRTYIPTYVGAVYDLGRGSGHFWYISERLKPHGHLCAFQSW